ncbi:MAG: hypothetical protein DHS20C15_14670 [Planctomycetota bacterium]|nr:MAG: hypothetical protein DHS20C15_14670 [Planctomycetota bacterium]
MSLGSPAAALPAALSVFLLFAAAACPLASPQTATAVVADDSNAADVAPLLEGSAAWAAFDAARAQLALATRQQQDPSLWSDVRDNAQVGLEELAQVGESVGRAHVDALHATLRAVIARQDASESRWQARTDAGEDPSTIASVETRWTTTAGSLADGLIGHEGLLPETSVAISDLLFEAGRDGEAQQALRRALALWPSEVLVHEQLRSWTARLPQPAALIQVLHELARQHGRNNSTLSGHALESSSALSLELGRRAYERAQASGSFDDYTEAANLFEASAHDLSRSRSMPRQPGDSDVQSERATTLINAGWAQYAVAWGRWSEDRESEAAWEAAAASQQAFKAALAAEPGNPTALAALSRLGTLVGTKAQSDNPLTLPAEDKADIRDYFGELAAQYDIAEWWNNFGLFSRDTGESAAADGDTELARALFEQSYAAYLRAIELSPNDTRMVNDTGVMLYYYLQRELDLAEEYFLRAIELGNDSLDNPFADRAADLWQQELAAYLDAKLNLARLYADLDRLDEASAVIDDATRFDREIFEAGDQPAVRIDLLQTKARIDAAKDSGES